MLEKTIAALAAEIASPEPGPAGVAVSALTAAFAMDLVTKVLSIRGMDPAWIEQCRTAAAELRVAAEFDAAAVRASDREAMMHAPMRAARSAIEGLEICRDSAAFVTTGHIAADLAAAHSVLLGAACGILVCLDANLKMWPDEAAAREVAALWGQVQPAESGQPGV